MVKDLYNLTKEEGYFKQYLDSINREVKKLIYLIVLYLHLSKRIEDHNEEINISPAFFQMVLITMFTCIIVWTDRLIGLRSKRNLLKFLNIAEQNIKIFTKEAYKRRTKKDDNYWYVRDYEEITLKDIEEDRNKIRSLEALTKSLKLRRDKYIAHFDKEYFFEPGKLDKDAPIFKSDIGKLIDILKDIPNRYSGRFNGVINTYEAVNIRDVDNTLRILRKYREGLKRKD